ncbi:hypothetical protein D3C72_1720990 [compost metagenome]
MIAVAMPGKALTVAAQTATLLGDRQVVIRAYKLPQADVLVTRCQQLLEAYTPHQGLVVLTAGLALSELGIALRRLGVIEHPQPIRLQFNQGGQLQRKTVWGLPCVTVPQVNTHRAVVKGASSIDQ